MATRKRDDERARALGREMLIGRDVLYVMTDGTTVRPAKIVDVDDAREDNELRATLAIFTAGALDRGLIEHAERGDGGGREPTVVVRVDVLNVPDPLEGEHEYQGTNGNRCALCGLPPVGADQHLTHPRAVLWPGHTWHVPPATVGVRVSGTAPTEAPPALTPSTSPPTTRKIVGLKPAEQRAEHVVTPDMLGAALAAVEARAKQAPPPAPEAPPAASREPEAPPAPPREPDEAAHAPQEPEAAPREPEAAPPAHEQPDEPAAP